MFDRLCIGGLLSVSMMDVAQGSFVVKRPHVPERSPLRAWDAADEYALGYVADAGVAASNWLLINDGFGALSVALAEHSPVSWGDSVVAHDAARKNLVENGLASDTVAMMASTTDPSVPLEAVIVKVPKTLALLEQQLHTIRPLLRPDSIIVGAGMAKAIHTSTLELFEAIIGPTKTSLAKKKARLIHASLDPDLDPGPTPEPIRYLAPWGSAVVNLPNVFSQRRLDIGTRLLLDHLPTNVEGVVCDLGCGNGIVGTAIAVANPDAELHFTDISYQALASARATFEAAVGEDRTATYLAVDCLDTVAPGSLDLVLNNPPFHDGHAVGDDTAWRMFSQARDALRPGGKLRVVGNRHLGYHTKMKKVFGNQTLIASNPKFVVLESER